MLVGFNYFLFDYKRPYWPRNFQISDPFACYYIGRFYPAFAKTAFYYNIYCGKGITRPKWLQIDYRWTISNEPWGIGIGIVVIFYRNGNIVFQINCQLENFGIRYFFSGNYKYYCCLDIRVLCCRHHQWLFASVNYKYYSFLIAS